MSEESLHRCELAEGRWALARLSDREEEEGQELQGVRKEPVSSALVP